MGGKHRVTQLCVPRTTRSLGSSDSVNKEYGMLGCICSQPYQTRDSRVLGWRGSSLSLSEAPFTSMGSECLPGALFPTHKETLAGCLGHMGLQKSMPCKDTTAGNLSPREKAAAYLCHPDTQDGCQMSYFTYRQGPHNLAPSRGTAGSSRGGKAPPKGRLGIVMDRAPKPRSGSKLGI